MFWLRFAPIKEVYLNDSAPYTYAFLFNKNFPSGMGNALKKELLRYGLSELASHVVVDTVPYMSYTQPVSAYNAISKAWPGKISK